VAKAIKTGARCQGCRRRRSEVTYRALGAQLCDRCAATWEAAATPSALSAGPSLNDMRAQLRRHFQPTTHR
jgi:hypothetical protein